jgi:hypothetical protein
MPIKPKNWLGVAVMIGGGKSFKVTTILVVKPLE